MTIGIIGLGAMGLGIAQVYAQAGQEVLATDADPAARDSAGARLAQSLAGRVAKGAMTEAEREAILGRLRVVAQVEDLAPADLVIEAVVERLAVKQAVFAALEPLLKPDAILATNTSSLSVAAIAAGLARPERLVGLHFFNPAPAMRLVELIPHPGTAPDALARARSLTEAAGKTVIQCADRPGFIVNRCARPYYGEALALLEEGRAAGEIDAAMAAAGYPIGPFGLIDLIGADINLAATESLATAMANHPRYHVFPALRAQVARGDLGRKSGRGFVFPAPPAAMPTDAVAIVQRIEAALVNEAAWLLAEGGATAEDIDTALRLGLNFPRGPFAMLKAHGRDTVLATLAALETAAPPGLKGRYLPAPDLSP
ncbi:3-hydroxybutyryl-CoA dehydrogenase [Tabrizicola piscis]|uniref:3-hydroxybutyryl-CoA dehydrogenase n=1 Tax=Tabrizicola piscis TaxID=2494374 RepID=A0A3S8U720_9RHOB|nr:3-hydroxyacyl-CoA dehydrogenase NAD-binding domain-containing protein [Tabrizicola piscis]AZL59391.1 3-hydroxybutyryl-CoA dehydrogenase [Tabrizicola piscis]